MTVVPFVSCRFVPSDVQRFMEFAGRRVKCRIWKPVERKSDRSCDQFLVTPAEFSEPVLSFRRDERGRYGVWFRDALGWHEIRGSECAEDCLKVLGE